MVKASAGRPTPSYTVEFWLKPHLANYARTLFEGEQFVISLTNPIGAAALSVLTPKHGRAHVENYGPDFPRDRVKVVGMIGMAWAEKHGKEPAHLAAFEAQVEHLFYHSLLTWVDVQMEHGMGQNEAIRTWLDKLDVPLDHLQFDSVKKTVIRRRARLHQVRSSRKCCAENVPTARRA